MILNPQDVITDADRERGMRNLVLDAAFATAIGALNSGVVLLALALHIGVGNIGIGMLAAIPLLTQVLQAPAVTLVERVRRRRLISVVCGFTARLALPVYAVIPFVENRTAATALLMLAALLHYGMNAVSACSWNSWMRDLLPQSRLGDFFGRRLAWGTLVSAAATIGAAIALQRAGTDRAAADRVFAGLYVVGFVCGMVSTLALARVPEPRMAPATSVAPLRRLLAQPLQDVNFRHVLRYLASWQFAVNIAGPFFTVYFVRELGFPMSFVLALTLVSQLSNAAVVRFWGKLSDRFTNKSVLAAVTPLNLVAVAGVAFAGEFDGTATRMAYLVLLHMIMGACGAGIGLAINNIVIKLSPGQAATSYMAANALIVAVAAGAAPIIGGWLADFFATRQFSLSIDWTSPSGTAELFGFGFQHWEFFFLLSAGIGLYALGRLGAVNEPGSVAPQEVVDHIVAAARTNLRNASSVAGVRQALAFPAGALIKSREGTRFVLESLFERPRDPKQPDTASEAIGTLLDATFEPIPDDEFEALLRKLDERR